MKCLACGSSNLVEGVVTDSNAAPVFFQITDKPKWKQLLGVGQRVVVTHACVHCGLVQQRVTFTSKAESSLPGLTGPSQGGRYRPVARRWRSPSKGPTCAAELSSGCAGTGASMSCDTSGAAAPAR